MQMIKSFLISMFAVLLFALGAVGSWFYLQMESEDAEDEVQPMATLAVERAANPVPKPETSTLPAIIRGPELDAEEMFRLTTATREKREQLREYEERLREHKQRIKAADADTKSAHREVEGMLGQVRNIMSGAEKLLDEVQLALNDLKKQKSELQTKEDKLKELEKEAGAGAAANMKTLSEYMASMPADVAAGAIKEMTNDGKIDFVVQLLRKIEPRNVSKILAELEDPQLLAEIAQRFRTTPTLR